MLIYCVFVEILLAQSCSSKWLISFEKHATTNSSANGNKSDQTVAHNLSPSSLLQGQRLAIAALLTMPVRLRMAMHGQRHNRIFHLVAINQRARRDAKPMELLGIYDPAPKLGDTHKTVKWSVDRIKYWLGVGALPSKSVVKLLECVSPFLSYLHAFWVLKYIIQRAVYYHQAPSITPRLWDLVRSRQKTVPQAQVALERLHWRRNSTGFVRPFVKSEGSHITTTATHT